MNRLQKLAIGATLCVSAFAPLAQPSQASASASSVNSACKDPVGQNFNTGTFEGVGMNPQPIIDLMKKLDSDRNDVRAVLIMRDCQLIFERYKEGVNRDNNHSLYSVTKSVVSTLVGALMHEGKLKSVDTPISELMTKPLGMRDAHWDKAKGITLKNVMQMASGFEYKHTPGTGSADIYLLSTDRFAYALGQSVIFPPGTKFNYSDADVSITGAVTSAIADQNLYRFAKRALFDPLQMVNHDWWFADRAGRYPGGWGLRLRPMDMLKLGQLYLQKGQWNGQSIFGPDYVDMAWARGVSPEYGLHWWIGGLPALADTPYFLANGFKGQRIYVFPTLGVVAAMFQSLPGAEERVTTRGLAEAIVRSVKTYSFPVNDTLKSEIDWVQKTPFKGETRVPQEGQDRPG